MSISQITTLSKPQGDEEVPIDTFAYFRARAKRFAYELAIKEFQKSGVTKATLGRRLGKKPDRVSKMLAGPGNWTIETLADLIFATSGGVPTFGVAHPLDRPIRNFKQPQWLTDIAVQAQTAAPAAATIQTVNQAYKVSGTKQTNNEVKLDYAPV
ncbi:MAG: hypothetical protein P4L80_04355 [Xanthobacteraceae bacterium]|nr:hypothetical protein [Xanthobacteraceae bacterium]